MPMIINPYAMAAAGNTDPFWAQTVFMASFEGADESTSYTDISSSPASLTGIGTVKIDTARHVAGALLLNSGNVRSAKSAAVGAGQFTLEGYIRPTSATTGRFISAQDLSTPAAVIALRTDSGGSLTAILRNSSNTGTVVLTSSTGLVAMNDTAEYHVAMTRDASNRLDIWLNGSSVANTTTSTNPDGGRAWDFGSAGILQEFFLGTLRWVRITHACRYTSSFTPPTLPLPTS